MLKNRILYVLVLAISALLFVVHGAWFYWVMLLTMLALPLVSLLFSLPAMVSFQLNSIIPPEAVRGTAVRVQLQPVCARWFLLPPFCFQVQIKEKMTDAQQKKAYQAVAAETVFSFTPAHCGAYEIAVRKGRVLDALGLWKFPFRAMQEQTVLVLPVPEKPKDTSFMTQLQPVAFKPKPGGGFSENHDNREYRPGDNVKDIRWKLSCKMDKLIVREPLIPSQQLVVAVQPALDADELDRALARLAWVSKSFSDNERDHTVFWRGAEGIASEPVKTEADGCRMMKKAVLAVPSTDTSLPLDQCAGAQIFFISGRESGVSA